jgi:raffinose/stachyose/melibiose transport system substrate-binding protein
VINSNFSRRNFLGLTAGAAGAAALAACGSSGPEDKSGGTTGGGAGAATYWSLSGEPGEPIRQAAIDRFNKANADSKITPTCSRTTPTSRRSRRRSARARARR